MILFAFGLAGCFHSQQVATLLNVDTSNETLMSALFETALNVKRQIYGNR